MAVKWSLIVSTLVQLRAVLCIDQTTTSTTVFTTADTKECQATAELRKGVGVIMSSADFPQPDNSIGCTLWSIAGGVNDTITISFEDLDILTDSDTSCTMGEVEIGPVPTVTLCGELRYMDPSKRSYISQRGHVWIKYRRQQEQIGRGFKLTYIISEKNPKSCYEDYYTCENGDCILRKWGCNGGKECSDGSDERECDQVSWPPAPIEPYKCRSGYFGCNDTMHTEYRCFPDSFLCDGTNQCTDGADELHCGNIGKCEQILEGPTGIINSPRYPGNPSTCVWDIHARRDSILQLRIKQFDLDPRTNDFVEVRDFKDDSLLGHFTATNRPPPVIESLSNRISLTLQRTKPGEFNATFQEKGNCLSWQLPCGFGELDCYEPDQRCDGTWECSWKGGDERGCGSCDDDKFSCGGGHQCYEEADHCNGQTHCTTKKDETNCSPQVCGPHNGTFLCANNFCIYESWRCDGANDCDDHSDESNCPLSRKVVIAAVVGSLVCALLLTVALGCTCQLHALRLREQNRRRYQSPLTRLQEAIASSRLAPPNYNEAMTTSRPYDEAQQEFLQRVEEARSQGDVDIPALITEVTTLPASTVTVTESESGPATRRNPRPQQQRQSENPPAPPRRPALPPPPPTPSESSLDQDDHSESSDDSLIEVPQSRETSTEASNVMVNISLDAGMSAQWRRQRPKDHQRATMPAITEDLRDEDVEEDSASGSLNSSVDIEPANQKPDNVSGLNGESCLARVSVSSSDSSLLSLNDAEMTPSSSKGTISKNNDVDMISLESLSSHSRSDEHSSDLTADNVHDNSAVSESNLSGIQTQPLAGDVDVFDDSEIVEVSDTQGLIC